MFEELNTGDRFMDDGDDATVWMKIDHVDHPVTGGANKVAIFSRLTGVVGLLGWTNETDRVHRFN